MRRYFDSKGGSQRDHETRRLPHRYLETPWSERWSSDGEFTGDALAHIVALSAEVGDSTSARAAYQRLATLWADADPEARPLLQEAERLLSK